MDRSRGSLSSESAQALAHLAAEGATVFTVDRFAQAMGRTREKTWGLLHSLLQGGWVLRLAKGKYLLVPLEAGSDSGWTEDSLVVACHLADPACVAYWTACHYWNWTEQVPRTVFVQTTQKKMESVRTVLGVRYQFVRITERKFFGAVERAAGRGRFTVTDREKTLVDALDRPDLCGGIGQVTEVLRVAEPVDWDKVDRYLAKIGSGAIYKRLGFLAEHLGKKLRLPDRTARIAGWRSRLTAGCAPLELGGAATGRVNSRWRVRVNAIGTYAKGRRS